MVTVNRQAYHEYFVDETIEAGIALTGTEVKSARAGHVNLRGAYARVKDDEVWLDGAHIAEYEHGTWANHDPLRSRRLLLHRREITRLEMRVQAKGQTLVPLKMYFKGNRLKVELGLCPARSSTTSARPSPNVTPSASWPASASIASAGSELPHSSL